MRFRPYPTQRVRARHSRRGAIEKYRPIAWLYILASLLLGWIVPRFTDPWLANAKVGPDQVIAFLSAVSTGMMAFTGIVFSLLFVLMQFGSSAYSPHLVALLARNPTLEHAQGVFTGTFLYSLMALRGVGAVAGERTTALTLWVALAWLLASVVLLVRLVNVFATLEITEVLQRLGDDGQRQIDHVYTRPARDTPAREVPSATRAAAAGAQSIVHHGRPGYLLELDVAGLVAVASRFDAIVRIPVATGDAVTVGTTIAIIEGATAPIPEHDLRGFIVLGRERSIEASPKIAIRLLVDIAIRALSPAVNDPTTAVHSLDQIEDLLVRIGGARLDVGTIADDAGTVRLVYATPTWEEYLELGLAEIQQYAANAVQVERRLGALVALLVERLPPVRHAAVERFARERIDTVRRSFHQPAARTRAEEADRQGLGHTEELHAT